MKKLALLGLGLCFAFMGNAQSTQYYKWIKKAGSTAYSDQANGVALDGSGNSYVVGTFSGTATFATGVTKTSNGGTDIFVAKYNSSGTLQWATSAGGTGNDEGKGIAFVTDRNGIQYLYITGGFSSSVTWPNSVGTTASMGSTDIYVARLDPSAGTWSWVSALNDAGSGWGGLGADMGTAITTDNNGKAYVTGYYADYIELATIPSTSLFHNGGNTSGTSMFYAGLQSNGMPLMGGTPSAASGDNAGYGISVLTSYIYLTGYFKGTTTFSTSMTSSGVRDIYIASANVLGGFISNRQAGGSSPETGFYPYTQDIGYGIVSTTSDVYVCGKFHLTGTFDSQSISGTSMNGGMFIAKYPHSSAGVLSACSWAYGATTSNASYASAAAYAVAYYNGDVYVTGECSPNISFAGASGSQTLYTTNSPLNCGYINRYDGSTGNIVWADEISTVSGSTGYGYGVAANSTCNVNYVGRFSGTLELAGVPPLISYSGSSDAFNARISPTFSMVVSPNQCTSNATTTLTTSYTGAGTAAYSWSPSTGLSCTTCASPVATVQTSPVTYTLTLSGTGVTCVETYTVTVGPVAPANAGNDKTYCLIAQVPQQLGTAAVSGATYSWSPATGLSSTTIAQPYASPTVTTNYTLTVTDGCGNITTDVVTVTANPGCRIAAPDNDESTVMSNVQLYPNPADGRFTISVPGELVGEAVIVITDQLGRIVYTSNVAANQLSIDLSDKGKGMYYVQVRNNDVVKVEKLLIQ